MSCLSSSNLFLFSGSFTDLNTHLFKIKETIKKKNEKKYNKKIAKNFASFCDNKVNEGFEISTSLAKKWLKEVNEDISQKETQQISCWIIPENNSSFIVYFHNIKNEEISPLLNKKFKAFEEFKNFKKSDSYCFKLFYPSNLSLEVIFKNLPSINSRLKDLATAITGNEWVAAFPETQWEKYLLPMLDFLKSEQGKKQINIQIKKIKKLKLIQKESEIVNA